jgi:F-type H+-transporting ATPase subunit b
MLLATNNFLLPNGTFFAEIIAFLIVLFVLWKWILPPVVKMMDERKEQIRSSIESATTQKAEAEVYKAEAQASIDTAKAEARTIVAKANAVAAQLKEEGRQRGQDEYDRLVALAQNDIQQAKNKAVEEVQKEFGHLVILAAEKIIGEELDIKKHERIINEAIDATSKGMG